MAWGTSGEINIPIDDDTMAKLTVIPTVAAMAATTRDTRLEEAFVTESHAPLVTVTQALEANLAIVRPVLERCECHLGEPELGPVWRSTSYFLRATSRRPWLTRSRIQPSRHGIEFIEQDEMVAIAPWLCSSALASLCKFQATFHHDCILLPDRHEDLMAAANPHAPGCNRARPAQFASLATDILSAHFTPEGIYGYERSLSNSRCVWCHRSEVHFLNPALYSAPLSVGQASPGDALKCAIAAINLRILSAVPTVTTVHITSWSSRLGAVDSIPDFGLMCFVLVDTRADSDIVLASGRIPVRTWYVGSGRSLGNYRMYIAASVPVGVRALVTDACLKTTSILDLSLPQVSPVECSPTHLNAICADMMVIAGGSTGVCWEMPVSRYAMLSNVWGLEEAVLTRSTHASFRADVRLSAFNLLWDVIPGMDRHRPIEFRSTVSGKFALASSSWRAGTVVATIMVKRWSSNARTPTAWWAASVLPLGRWEDVGPVEVSAQFLRPSADRGAPSTISAALANDVGVVNWYVFGSRGDVVPILALARRMAGWGIPVRVVNTLTDVQGQEVLAAVEQGRTLDAAPHFLQTMLHSMTAPGVVFGPPEFVGVSVGVSLRPPPSVIYPPDFGMGWLANFFLEAWMRTWAPIVNVGSFRGLYWLPRSADGVTFLRQSTKAKKNRRHKIMIAWGSSTLPRPEIAGAVDVNPGDHYAQFETAENVVTHGGAGTVQTAAAAGCTVIAATTVLDRRYRDPLDAGRGTAVGADPDSVMLMLLPSNPKIWLWAYKHSWTMFFRCIRWSMYWLWLPSLWLLAALSFKTFVFILHVPRIRIVFTTSFAGSLFATTLTGVLPPFWAMVLAPHMETLARYVLDHLGMTYASLVVHMAQFMAAASASSTTWAVLFMGGGWWALAAYALVNMTKVPALVAAELLALLITPVSVAPEGGWADLSVTWAYEGTNIPIFHTRMLNHDRTRVYEGAWVNNIRGLGSLYRIRASDYVVPHPTEWTFPTRIPWSVLESAPEFSAPYSPLWNCQSALLATTRGMWISLGVAGVVLAPMMLWSFLCAAVATVMTLVLVAFIDFLPGLAVIMEAAGFAHFLGPLRKICYSILAEALNSSNDWYGSVMAMTVGYATGWAAEQEGLSPFQSITKICRATTIKEVSDMLINGEIKDALALKIANQKIALLRASGV